MTTNTTVLVVDDDPSLVAVYAAYLENYGYHTVTAENSEQALTIISGQQHSIGIIVSDVEMPGMNGYEFCQAIKSDTSTKDTPFLFVSSHTTLEEKLKGYGVGGDDYVNKPVSPEELGFKIKMLLESKSKNRELKNQLAETHSAAMQAMNYSSDLGQIIEFYKNTMAAESFEQLSDFLFEITNAFGLNCTLQITSPERVFTVSNNGKVSPLESNVIELSRTKGRFFDFGMRTVINYDNFSLLTKNMPIDDPERYGVLKDTLGTLCNAIEARIKVILSKNAAQHNEVIFDKMAEMLEEVDHTFAKVQNANVASIEKMSDQIEEAMLTNLGLSEEQEESIRAIVQECLADSNRVYQEGNILNQKFEAMCDQLENVLGVTA